jgi:hypothetical protein
VVKFVEAAMAQTQPITVAYVFGKIASSVVFWGGSGALAGLSFSSVLGIYFKPSMLRIALSIISCSMGAIVLGCVGALRGTHFCGFSLLV